MRYKTILSDKNTAGEFTIPAFKLFCRAIVLKTTWYQNKSNYINQWNRSEDPDIFSNSYSCLILDKEKKKYIEEKTATTNGVGQTG